MIQAETLEAAVQLLPLLTGKVVVTYVGLSGVLHGLFVSGCLMDIRNGHRDALLLFILISAKLAWEQVSGPLPGSESTAGGHVVVDAHLYGALSGVVLVLPALLRKRHPTGGIKRH